MPLAVIESLVAGVPVVATAVGGLPELVLPGTGLLVPPDDAPALAGAIEAFVGERRPAADAAAFAEARARHDLGRLAGAWEQLYLELAYGRR